MAAIAVKVETRRMNGHRQGRRQKLRMLAQTLQNGAPDLCPTGSSIGT
jgi:hypothetical protein